MSIVWYSLQILFTFVLIFAKKNTNFIVACFLTVTRNYFHIYTNYLLYTLDIILHLFHEFIISHTYIGNLYSVYSHLTPSLIELLIYK